MLNGLRDYRQNYGLSIEQRKGLLGSFSCYFQGISRNPRTLRLTQRSYDTMCRLFVSSQAAKIWRPCLIRSLQVPWKLDAAAFPRAVNKTLYIPVFICGRRREIELADILSVDLSTSGFKTGHERTAMFSQLKVVSYILSAERKTIHKAIPWNHEWTDIPYHTLSSKS